MSASATQRYTPALEEVTTISSCDVLNTCVVVMSVSLTLSHDVIVGLGNPSASQMMFNVVPTTATIWLSMAVEWQRKALQRLWWWQSHFQPPEEPLTIITISWISFSPMRVWPFCSHAKLLFGPPWAVHVKVKSSPWCLTRFLNWIRNTLPAGETAY